MTRSLSKLFLITVASIALATQFGNGCTSDGGGYDDDDRYDGPSRPDYDRPSGPDYGGDRDIPRRARIVAEGRGDILKFRAGENGRVWLSDADRGRLIDSRGLGRGEEYIISTKDGKVWIDSDRKLDHNFDRDSIHRIYFLASDEEGGRRDDRGRDDDGRDDDRTDTRPPPREESGPIFGGGAGVMIPKSAGIVREGRGEDLSFVTDAAGTVFLYDVDARTSVASYRLKNGQRFTVSPSSGQASVDGQPVFRKSMSARKTYRLYFDLSV